MTGIPVQQTGNVTPGHLAEFVTSGVIADAGPQVAGERVLALLQGASFDTTTDQPLIIPPAITAFQLTGLLVCNASISLSAAIGGFYTAALKGGSQIVAPTQVYSSLTGPNLLLKTTLTSFAQTARFSASLLTNNTIYFALTTPQGVAAFADIYAVGVDLTP
jgi:hypothetical protein